MDKKFDLSNSLDSVNYELATNRIKTIIKNNMIKNHHINKNFKIFTYELNETCPLTGYFIKTLFDGPEDNPEYFEQHKYTKITSEIQKIINSYQIYELKKIINHENVDYFVYSK